MNPETNRLEPLTSLTAEEALKQGGTTAELAKALFATEAKLKSGSLLLRPNGEPVPDHWATFKVGEEVTIKDYRFKLAWMNESTLVFEPVGPALGASDG